MSKDEMTAAEIGRAMLGLTDRPQPGIRIGLRMDQPDERTPKPQPKGVTFASTDGDLALAAAAAYAQGQRQAAPPVEEQETPPADKPPTERAEIEAKLAELQTRVHALARKQGTSPAALEAAARAGQQREAAEANRQRAQVEHATRIDALARSHAASKGRGTPSPKDVSWAVRQIARGGK